MAEAFAVDLVERDLEHELRPDGLPVMAHMRRPAPRRPAQPPDRAALGQEAVFPRMADERHLERCKRLVNLATLVHRQADNHAHVIELRWLVFAIQAEHHRRDERLTAKDLAEAGNDAIGRLLMLDLDHLAGPGDVPQVRRLGHDAVDARPLVARQPTFCDTDVGRGRSDEEWRFSAREHLLEARPTLCEWSVS